MAHLSFLSIPATRASTLLSGSACANNGKESIGETSTGKTAGLPISIGEEVPNGPGGAGTARKVGRGGFGAAGAASAANWFLRYSIKQHLINSWSSTKKLRNILQICHYTRFAVLVHLLLSSYFFLVLSGSTSYFFIQALTILRLTVNHYHQLPEEFI